MDVKEEVDGMVTEIFRSHRLWLQAGEAFEGLGLRSRTMRRYRTEIIERQIYKIPVTVFRSVTTVFAAHVRM